MKLEKIITLANQATRIPFLAMERSLRAVGCQLPLYVIPYNKDIFDLPKNAHWWVLPELTEWLTHHQTSQKLRKYQCLLVDNYQFVDTDVIFLKNPESVLSQHSGFITSCGHWHNPEQTYTEESKSIFHKKSTIWQSKVFNSGQFACDRILYTLDILKDKCMQYPTTCLPKELPYTHEQPGMNLLTFISEVPIHNLTLPPFLMESTWAGDYANSYPQYWQTPNMPYLIHFAGQKMNLSMPISELFFKYLTQAETAEYLQTLKKPFNLKQTLKKLLK